MKSWCTRGLTNLLNKKDAFTTYSLVSMWIVVHTNNALMLIIQNIQTHLEDGKYVAESLLTSKRLLIQLIRILIKKLEHYNVRGVARLVHIISDGKETIVETDETSTIEEIVTGVPQGSILGPSFTLMI